MDTEPFPVHKANKEKHITMKKILSLTTLLLIVISSTAQETSESLLGGGRIWTTRSISTAPPDYGGYTEFTETKLEGAIVVDDISFWQVNERTRLAEEGQFGQWESKNEYIGQKDNKVYLYFKNTNTMFPVMDFSLHVGDTYRQYEGSGQSHIEYVVTAVSDTILNNSSDQIARKCIHLRSMDYQDVWIEGVGSVTTGIYGSYSVGFHGCQTTLMKCIDGNDLLFQSEDVSTSIYTVESSKPSKGTIFDLQGRRINSHPAKGIYIRDGRKVIVK